MLWNFLPQFYYCHTMWKLIRPETVFLLMYWWDFFSQTYPSGNKSHCPWTTDKNSSKRKSIFKHQIFYVPVNVGHTSLNVWSTCRAFIRAQILKYNLSWLGRWNAHCPMLMEWKEYISSHIKVTWMQWLPYHVLNLCPWGMSSWFQELTPLQAHSVLLEKVWQSRWLQHRSPHGKLPTPLSPAHTWVCRSPECPELGWTCSLVLQRPN